MPRWSLRCSACPPDGGVGRQDRAHPRQVVPPQGHDPLAGRRQLGAPHLQRPRPHRHHATGQDLPRLPAQVPLAAEATAGALRLWLGHPRPHPHACMAITESRRSIYSQEELCRKDDNRCKRILQSRCAESSVYLNHGKMKGAGEGFSRRGKINTSDRHIIKLVDLPKSILMGNRGNSMEKVDALD